MEEEEFDKALEKLAIHGGARIDFGGNVTAGGPGWKKGYTVQAQHRAEQFKQVLRFTAAQQCRMAALVRHFGDDRRCRAQLRQVRRVRSGWSGAETLPARDRRGEIYGCGDSG